MPTPSLLIVPARFKTGKIYSQIPTSGAGDFTVTRATTATRVNASGLIESVASGIPRLDYFASGGTVGCPALLVEPSAQNLAFHSETWASGNNWNLSNGATRATGSTDAFKTPDGTFTANAISPTSGNVQHFAQSNSSTTIAYTSGTIYTMSAFFKAGGTNLPVSGNAGRYVQLSFNGTIFTQLFFANFDLQDGIITASGSTSADANRNARIENYGNGWYRCSLTATCPASGSNVGIQTILITASGATRNPTYAGTVTDVLYGWGAQVETGSVATSYIPTTTGSVTRNADVVSVSGAVSGSIGQTEGTIYAEVDYRNFSTSSQAAILHLFQDGNNMIGIQMVRSGSDNLLQAYAFVLGSLVMSITYTIPSAGIYKIALGYKLDDYKLYVNGVDRGQDTSAGVPTMNQILLGHYTSSIQFNDRIRAAALYTTRLTNDQLAALTAP